MKKTIDIQDDPFLKDLFKEQPQEILSSDFSSKVMNKIRDKETTPIVIEPIINKKNWVIISTIMIVLLSFVIFSSEGGESGTGVSLLDNIFTYLNTLNFLENIKMPSFSTPGKVLYATIAFLSSCIGRCITYIKKAKTSIRNKLNGIVGKFT